MEKLKKRLDEIIETLSKKDNKDLIERLDNLMSVYPFNEYEYIISSLLGFKKLTLDDYFEIRDDYISRNLYLYIFEISTPRGFGEQWAQGHLKELVPELIKPTKKLDQDYSGQYDFYFPLSKNKDKKEVLQGIKIEVKASRAVDFDKPSEALYVKALSSDSNEKFDMNFQQIKPKCADVFVWIGVWRDVIRYWILSSQEVAKNKYYSKGQHRGNVGEGQLHIMKKNIKDFEKYEVKPTDLLKNIVMAYSRNGKRKK